MWSRWINSTLVLAVVLSCVEQTEDIQARDGRPATASMIERIAIDEDERSLLVEPRVRIDPHGGFLVADVQEAQVRRYDTSGRLLWSSGGRGHGPGEYVAPVSAVRLRDGTVAVLDRSNRLTLLTSQGEYLDSFALPFARVSGLVPVDEQRILIRGLAMEGPELLHYLDLGTRTIEAAFLPVADLGDASLSRSLAYATADVLNDRIAAAHGPLDSVYVYDLNGRRLESFRLPVDNYRLATPSPTRDVSPEKRAEWESTWESMSGIWWVGPTRLAVGYKTLVPGGIVWHWAVVTTRGELVYQAVGTGELLTADPSSATLLTVAPESVVPNLWQRISVDF